MFADFLNDNKEWVKQDNFVSLRLKLSLDDSNDSLGITVQQGFSFEETKKLLSSKIFVGSEDGLDNIQKFEEICSKYASSPQESDVTAILCLPSESGRRNRKVKVLSVNTDPKLTEELKSSFGTQWVKEIFHDDVDKITFPELINKKQNKNYNRKVKRGAFSS